MIESFINCNSFGAYENSLRSVEFHDPGAEEVATFGMFDDVVARFMTPSP